MTARVRRAALVPALFLLIAFAVHAAGTDVWRNLLGGGDGYTAGLPSKLFAVSLSPWNPYVQIGQYAFANTQFQPFYPPALFFMALFPSTLGYNLFILFHYAAAGWFFYLFARGIPLGSFASFLGGLSFMCSGFLMAHKGHQAMMSTAVWLPLMLLFGARALAARSAQDAAFGGVALGMSILGGFPQVTVYSVMVFLPYFAFRWWQAGRPRHAAAALAVFFLTAVLIGSLQLFAVAETLPYITRQSISLAMFSEDSLPAYHLLALFVPNLLGGFFHVPTYSSNVNVVELYPYTGLLPLVLALFALFVLHRRSAEVRFWATVALAGLVLSLGLAPLQRVLHHVPVYNLFRAPARHLFEIHFAVAVLAAFGVSRLFDQPGSRRAERRALRTACVTVAALLGAVLAMSQVLRYTAVLLSSPGYSAGDVTAVTPLYTLGALEAALVRNLHPAHPTILYPVVFLLLTIGVLLVAWRRRSLPLKIALAAVFTLDVWSVARTLYSNPDTTDLYGTDRRPEVAAILRSGFDRDHFRILPIDYAAHHTFPLLNMMYGLSAVNDYTPMWLKRYQAVTGFALSGGAGMDLLGEPKLLSAIGTQYLLAKNSAMVEGLRSIPQPADLPVRSQAVPPLNCPALHCAYTEFPAAASMALRSPDSSAIAIVHFPVELQPSTFYEVEFEARAPRVPDKPLVVDLYSAKPGRPPYDDAAQDRAIFALGTQFDRFSILLNSGPAAPPDAFLRIYTQSSNPIEIRNLEIGTVQSRPLPAYTEFARMQDGLTIFKNPAAAPRFRFATELRPARDLGEARQILLNDPAFDPVAQAVVEGLAAPATVSPGRITGETIRNNFLEWQVETGARSFFVVADSWFPGWTAAVDGRPVDIRIVNGFMRGIFIEGAGRHIVTMRFWPVSLTAGLAATALGLALIFLLLLLKSKAKATTPPSPSFGHRA